MLFNPSNPSNPSKAHQTVNQTCPENSSLANEGNCEVRSKNEMCHNDMYSPSTCSFLETDLKQF